MTILDQPKTDDEAIAYAKALAQETGMEYVPIRLPVGNPFGLTHSAVFPSELSEYIAYGCKSLIKAGATIEPLNHETLPLMTTEILDEAEETRRGQYLVEMLKLEEVKTGHRIPKSYDPPRYYTQWETKSALELFRSVKRIIETGRFSS